MKLFAPTIFVIALGQYTADLIGYEGRLKKLPRGIKVSDYFVDGVFQTGAFQQQLQAAQNAAETTTTSTTSKINFADNRLDENDIFSAEDLDLFNDYFSSDGADLISAAFFSNGKGRLKKLPQGIKVFDYFVNGVFQKAAFRKALRAAKNPAK